MPSDRRPADSAEEWLNRAASDLALASVHLKNVYIEDLCFHAQQAAEKALKAVFLSRGWTFPRIHDLAALITLLLEQGMSVPADVQSCACLTEYAVEGRYPGFDESPTDEEYREALSLAEHVLGWARNMVAGPGAKTET